MKENRFQMLFAESQSQGCIRINEQKLQQEIIDGHESLKVVY